MRSYLLLAEVALALNHTLSAAQLALSALRRIQHFHTTTSSSSSSSITMVHWLQCRKLLSQALSNPSTDGWCKQLQSSLSCLRVCEEGAQESQDCGDPELAAQFLYIAASHLFLRRPCPIPEVMTYSQQALHQLESVPQLSLRGELLQVQASLLLAESMCRGGPVTSQVASAMTEICRLLQHQV